MSTKTMFKRIALATVSALGFGLLAGVPSANATFTTSFSVPVTSVTVVTPASGVYDSSNANGAIFRIQLRNAGTTATSWTLRADETLTATVVSVPAGTGTAKTLDANRADLALHKVAPATSGYAGTAIGGNPYVAETRAAFANASTDLNTATWGGADSAYQETLSADGRVNSFYLRVTPAAGKTVIDQGEYTVRLRLTSGNSSLLVQDTLVRVRFVSSAINAGAILTATGAGSFPVGSVHESFSADKFLRATLTDANGGRVVVETTAGTVARPSLTTDIINSAGTVINGANTVNAKDDGSNDDSGWSGADGGTAVANTDHQNIGNGVYGIELVKVSGSGPIDTATVGSTNSLRVRYADKSATYAMTITSAAGGTALTPSVVGAGIPVTNVSPNWSLPLTTTSATVRFPGATPGNAYTVTTTWTGTASGSVTPTSATPTLYYADANGIVSVALTNSAPVNGATATVSISGFLVGTAAVNQVLTWRSSTANNVSVDIDGAFVAVKSTTTATATVTDHFGAPVVGALVVPSFSLTSDFYSATRTYAALTTNASGQVSYTWTDATAVATDFDRITFTVVGTTVSGSGTVTYAAANPAPTALSAFYNVNPAATQNFATVATAVPTTGIYASGTTEFPVVTARDNARPITVASGQDSLLIRVDGNVQGARIVATGTSGVWFLGANNLATTSRTLYADINGDAYFIVGSTKAGANTVTFTSGSVTTTAAFWTASGLGNTRNITITGPATGTANGDLLVYNVSVADRYGNPMSGATVSITASGVAVLGGGSTVASYTTDSTGTFSFTGTSLNSAGGAGTFKVSVTTGATANQTADNAGFVGATEVAGVSAGNSSATAAVTFAAGSDKAQAAAEAATDAALEAIDAANAATDAANLAAEAADAATVAAEEARDAADAATAAVEALASEVATLIAGLKAQITTLANTVAKIAKRVRA